MFIWPLLPVPTQSPFFVNICHILHIHVQRKCIYIKEARLKPEGGGERKEGCELFFSNLLVSTDSR